MPEVETRLWDGATIQWSAHKAPIVVRCKGQCHAVYPADTLDELATIINPATGVCRECEGTR